MIEAALAVSAGVVFALGILIAIRSFGEADTSWDDVHERRNGDR